MSQKKLIKNLLALGLVFSIWGIFGFHSGELGEGGDKEQINTGKSLQTAETETSREAIIVEIDIAKQIMTVHRDGEVLYIWKISTGRAGYKTPGGSYRPQRMYTMWHSRTYNNAPMPYAIFFHNGYAIHGTTAIGRLGSPASHGCVRLETANAKELYKLVTAAGVNETQILVLN
ncbi:MAG: hypothetical protein DU429_04985 [Candidatus Tokpelaia sp.]|nr:MAG: hypothetical protein DU430_00975 [Candidatus Tokpelaia sp.]KAA6206977.1 MAG: hypothetical protein DU429_04985 [Candidatus Tokpelaia sp.]